MKGIIRQVGKDADATQENIEKTLAGSDFFWLDLDLHDPGPDDDVAGLLTGIFHFHPLAVASAIKFGLRPRIAYAPRRNLRMEAAACFRRWSFSTSAKRT